MRLNRFQPLERPAKEAIGNRMSEYPWWQPETGETERRLINEVLDNNFLNEGETTRRFEEALSERLGCDYCVAVTSGTAALFAALYGLGVGPGDEVILPDLTFIATANAVTWTGATPVLVDIEPDRLTIDPAAVRRAITSRTKAIVPVHLSGRAADMQTILVIAKEHDLFVVEDAAEALLSKSSGQCLGTFGNAGCFSFSPMKTIQTGQGGAVVTNNQELAHRLCEIKDQGRRGRGTGGNDLHYAVGFNFKLTNLQAAIGLGQLEQLDRRIARLREIYSAYETGLRNIAGIDLPGFDLEGGECPQWVDALSDRRDELHGFLADRQMGSRPFWYPLHTQDPYRQNATSFPNSVKLAARALWLPSAFTLVPEQIMTVCDAIRSFSNGAEKVPANRPVLTGVGQQ